MKTNMSEHDKKLLVSMFIGVIIVAIGYWGILPQVKAYRALEGKIETEKNIKKINELKMINVGSIQIQADDYENRIAKKKDEFYQILNSSEVDRMMTEMATSNGLDIYELSFSMPSVPTERLAYQNSALYENQLQMIANYQAYDATVDNTEEVVLDSSDESVSESDDQTGTTLKVETAEEVNAKIFGEEEGGYRPNTDIYAVPVTMTVGGELSDLHSFINDIINNDKRLLMVGYAWGEYRNLVKRGSEGNVVATVSESGELGVTSEELENEELELITKKSLTVRLELYMCDTTDVEVSDVEASDTEAVDAGTVDSVEAE